MLDILLAIKNNNMTKIPQYDPTHVEHLKKLMRTLIRKGNYVTQLNISLDDLMKGISSIHSSELKADNNLAAELIVFTFYS